MMDRTGITEQHSALDQVTQGEDSARGPKPPPMTTTMRNTNAIRLGESLTQTRRVPPKLRN